MGGLRTFITSSIFIMREGFATTSPPGVRNVTRPFLQLSVATVRVLNIRMAHSHLSILTSVFIGSFVVEIAHGALEACKYECADRIGGYIDSDR